jgi:NDP-hexose 4-ketoreductase
MPRALVIAGESFVGKYVVAELRNHGFDSLVTTRCTSQTQPASSICDVTDSTSIDAVVREHQPDVLVNCAGIITADQPELAQRVHVDGTKHVVDAIKQFAPKCALLSLGSAAEYGPADVLDLPLYETYPPEPASSYGGSKLEQTRVVEQAVVDGLTAYVVRPFNIIGPGLPSTYFAAGLASRLLKLDSDQVVEFEVFNPNATRDFVDVRDVARAIRLLLTVQPKHDSIVYNICTDRQTSLTEVAELMGDLAGGHRPKPAGEADSRGGISYSQGSYAKLKKYCSWEPKIEWQTSIRDLYRAQEDIND